MIAKIAILGTLVIALLAGILLYYLQVYAYYDEVTAEETGGVTLVSVHTNMPEEVLYTDFQAIDSDSSPLRYRACYQSENSLAMLTETYVIYEDAVPTVGPGWFGCFDAKEVGEDLEFGRAVAFLAYPEITYGFDRITAVYPDGRSVSWHQINACGELFYEGEPLPVECPPAPEGLQ